MISQKSQGHIEQMETKRKKGKGFDNRIVELKEKQMFRPLNGNIM